MNKFLAYLILAASPFALQADSITENLSKGSGIHHYGYFYVTDEQTLDEKTDGVYDSILWNSLYATETHKIYLNADDLSQVILEEKGIYLVTFTATALNPDDQNFRFALLLNGDIIPGSVYGVYTAALGDPESLSGQVIFQVLEKNSVLQLVNASIDPVTLYQIDGPVNDPENVTASLLIEQIHKLHHH